MESWVGLVAGRNEVIWMKIEIALMRWLALS